MSQNRAPRFAVRASGFPADLQVRAAGSKSGLPTPPCDDGNSSFFSGLPSANGKNGVDWRVTDDALVLRNQAPRRALPQDCRVLAGCYDSGGKEQVIVVSKLKELLRLQQPLQPVDEARCRPIVLVPEIRKNPRVL